LIIDGTPQFEQSSRFKCIKSRRKNSKLFKFIPGSHLRI